jgi:hypothetical protein
MLFHGGAYAPRSWLHDVCSLQKATFALHKRTFPRAAGVSPPWVSESHLQVQCDKVPRLDLACGVHATGGLRSPLMMHGPVAFRLLLTLFGVYLFESVSCLRASSGCCLRCSEVNQA